MSTDFGASASRAEDVYKQGHGNSVQDAYPTVACARTGHQTRQIADSENDGPSLILVALKIFFAVVFKGRAMMPLCEKLLLLICLLPSLFIHFRVSSFMILA